MNTSSCASLVWPDIISICRINNPGQAYILETTNGEPIPILEIDEAKLQIGQRIIIHRIFVTEIIDKVIFHRDILQKFGFRLDLKRKTIKLDDEEIFLFIPSSPKLGDIRNTEDVVLLAWSDNRVDVILEILEAGVSLLIKNNEGYFDNQLVLQLN